MGRRKQDWTKAKFERYLNYIPLYFKNKSNKQSALPIRQRSYQNAPAFIWLALDETLARLIEEAG